MAAFAEEMEVELAEGGPEAVGVFDDCGAGGCGHRQLVGRDVGGGQLGHEHARELVVQGPRGNALAAVHLQGDSRRVGTVCTDDGTSAFDVRAEHPVRVAVLPRHHPRQVRRHGVDPRRHAASSSRRTPSSGMEIQSGRWAAS